MRRCKANGRFLLFAASLCFCAAVVSAQPTNTSSSTNQPAGPTHSPAALSSFHIRPGFRLEVAAIEPMVVAPVAIAFDENGRLFVAEMRDNPSRTNPKPQLGRIRMLEGVDKDGQYQTSSVYADNLALPSALACYAGGLFVAVAPQIIYLKSNQGEGAADVTRIVFSGFGGTNAPNGDALLNNFNWGLDNRIHGATAGIGGMVTAQDWPGSPVSLDDSDFAFDPRTLVLQPESGPAQSGLTFDDQGRKLLCDLDHPLRLALYERRYALRNPFWPRSLELLDVASRATPIYAYLGIDRAVPRATLAGNVLPVGQPRANPLSSTWLTHARGCVVYRGGIFGTNFSGNVFVADPEAHAVHRFVLRDQGLAVVAETAPDERSAEFLASDDPAFRPVQLVNGPEGALYIVDAREDAEHGRIYRIMPEHFQLPKAPQLGKTKTYDLVAALARPEGWQRDTAARLLFEHRDPAAAPLLAGMLKHSKLPVARLHALHALAGCGTLSTTHLLDALRDSDPIMREHAVLLSERLTQNGALPDQLWNQLKLLAADPAPRVRYQLGFTAGEIQREDRIQILAEVLGRGLASPWMQGAVLSSLSEGAGPFFSALANTPRFRNDAAGLHFLAQLATFIGIQGHMDDVARVEQILSDPALDRLQAFALLQALGQGLHRTRSSLALVDPQSRFVGLYAQAFNAALDASLPESSRVTALRLLAVSPYKFMELGDWLLLLCNPPPFPALQSAAIDTLGHFDDPGVVKNMLGCWPGLAPGLRQQALATLLSRTSHVSAVLDAIEARRISLADVTSVQANFLRTYRDPSVSRRAMRLFGPVDQHRPQALAQFSLALRLNGRADYGRAVFLNRCAGCHSFLGIGQPFGPDLSAVRTRGREKLLTAILEPNADVARGYATCVVATKEGENLVGTLADDNPAAITLRQPHAVQLVWPRLNIESVQIQTWSLMPDGLEQGLSLQEMADLLEYLMTAQ